MPLISISYLNSDGIMWNIFYPISIATFSPCYFFVWHISRLICTFYLVNYAHRKIFLENYTIFPSSLDIRPFCLPSFLLINQRHAMRMIQAEHRNTVWTHASNILCNSSRNSVSHTFISVLRVERLSLTIVSLQIPFYPAFESLKLNSVSVKETAGNVF